MPTPLTPVENRLDAADVLLTLLEPIYQKKPDGISYQSGTYRIGDAITTLTRIKGTLESGRVNDNILNNTLQDLLRIEEAFMVRRGQDGTITVDAVLE